MTLNPQNPKAKNLVTDRAESLEFLTSVSKDRVVSAKRKINV